MICHSIPLIQHSSMCTLIINEVLTCSSRLFVLRATRKTPIFWQLPLRNIRGTWRTKRRGRTQERTSPAPHAAGREWSGGVAPLVQDSRLPHDRWTGDRGRFPSKEAPRHSFPRARRATGWGRLLQGAAHDQPSRVDSPTGRALDRHFL
jgi:hypothetical protein